MKTLYININNEQIQSNEELEVLKHDLDSDFFFYLGEKIAKGCKLENENALITDFNTQENEEDYQQIIAQWNEIKTILFSEECEGKIEFTLPNGYIHWLRYSEKYNHVYDKNFSHGEPLVIYIDLKELYEESVEDLQRKILRKLQRDDLYLEIDVIVYNDDAVTRKSSIVRAIRERYEGLGFKADKKWLQEKENDLEENLILPSPIVWPIDLRDINVDKIVKLGYTPILVIGHNDSNYIVLALKDNKKCIIDTSGCFLYNFDYAHAIPTKTGKYAIVKLLSPESRYYGLIKVLDGTELLPCTYCGSDELNEWEPGFFSNTKVGEYCAFFEVHCDYSDKNIFIDKKNLKIYSKKSWKCIEIKKYFSNIDRYDLQYYSLDVNQINNIYSISFSSYSSDFRFIISEEVDKLYVLRNDENIDNVNNDKIVLKQFEKISAILNKNFECIYKVDFVLASNERIVDVSDGMTIIMDEYKISRILDENYNNILKNTFVRIDRPIKFQDGVAVYLISKKRIGCINKQGEYIELPWNFGNTISDIEVLIPPFIMVTKTSEERFIIDTNGESVVDVGRWDKIRRISKTQFEVYNCNNSTLYEVKDNKIYKIA